MARWNEEQERWTGRGDRYGEDERRFRGERGEEGGWRGRDWRDDDRFGGWRGSERGREGGEWREARSERWRPSERRYGLGSEPWRREGEYGERSRGERWRGEGADWGAYGGGMDPDSGRGGMWGTGLYGGEYGGGGAYPMDPGSRYGGYGRGEPGGGEWGRGRGDYATYGSSTGEWYGRGEGREWGRESGRSGGEERGPMERFGEKLREGMRKLTGHAPKGYRRSDDRVRDEVCEWIARSWVNAEDVEVRVEKGEVTLTGFVERRDEKRAIEDLAEDVFGVEEVHNHVRIRREPQTMGQTAGTGTTGTGAAMSGQQQTTRPGASQQPGHAGRH